MSAVFIALRAQQRAQEVKITSCQGIEQSFNSTTATVVQKQQYAECVQTIYPVAHSATEVVVMKIAVALIFVGCAVGSVLGWKEQREWFDAVLGFLIGGVVATCAEALLLVCYLGVLFLFT